MASSRSVLAIIGGGFAGAAIAWHLGNSRHIAPGSVIVFEPRERLGLGLAYGTEDNAHRINVPATRMCLFPDDCEHFARWMVRNQALKGDPLAEGEDGHLYPRRSTFGAYMHSQLQPQVDLRHVVHQKTRATGLTRTPDDRWLITDESGKTFLADFVVLATSHPEPEAPKALSQILADHPGYIPNPSAKGCLDAIAADDRILIIGNGLTSADIIASLADRGHKGSITAISRHGLRSRAHSLVPQESYGDFTGCTSKTAVNLLRRIRFAIIEAKALGLSWHSVLDAVRSQGQEIWQCLPVEEQRRIVRHLRPFWDVHRFRLAPQVDQVVTKGIATGQIAILAGRLGFVSLDGKIIKAGLRLKGHKTIVADFDAVIVATGPAHGSILKSQPLLSGAGASGRLAVDPTGLGLWCNRKSEALTKDGHVNPGLYIAGPLARGTFGELMGLPQVSAHAKAVAETIIDKIAHVQDIPPDTLALQAGHQPYSMR